MLPRHEYYIVQLKKMIEEMVDEKKEHLVTGHSVYNSIKTINSTQVSFLAFVQHLICATKLRGKLPKNLGKNRGEKYAFYAYGTRRRSS